VSWSQRPTASYYYLVRFTHARVPIRKFEEIEKLLPIRNESFIQVKEMEER
jgi:hypothetical protein